MERTPRLLEKLADRVRAGQLKWHNEVLQAAERILSKNHGARYYRYTISSEDAFTFSECESFEQEKQIEGKYVIANSEKSMEMLNTITSTRTGQRRGCVPATQGRALDGSSMIRSKNRGSKRISSLPRLRCWFNVSYTSDCVVEQCRFTFSSDRSALDDPSRHVPSGRAEPAIWHLGGVTTMHNTCSRHSGSRARDLQPARRGPRPMMS